MNKLLFVDDEPRVLDGLRRMLRSKCQGWECFFAENVDSALEVIDNENLGAIVSDINMPGRSGLELLRLVRSSERTQFLPVLMLTGKNDVKAKRTALELGATDFLNKPFDFAELTARVQNAVALKGFQDEIRRQNEILEQMVAARTQALEISRRDIIFRFAKVAETRDTDTGDHIIRVGLISKLIARQMGLDEKIQEKLLLTAPLHDVGKIGISDDILRKPGALTSEQRHAMEDHCKIGAQILSEAMGMFLEKLGTGSESPEQENDLLNYAARIALCHHERWDGTGYPNGLHGEEIPVEARIVAVADVYDALRSERPYKRAFNVQQSIGILKESSGAHFDPKVVGAFLEIVPEIEPMLYRTSAVIQKAA